MYTWFHSVSSLLLPVLAGLFRFTQDWGLAVIALTLLVKTGLFYFNLLAARQQIRSIQAQPRLKELRERHGSGPREAGCRNDEGEPRARNQSVCCPSASCWRRCLSWRACTACS
ncbi:hypothetical protein LJK87_42860 [Paenibacillus sp. P25]|nr:hypothetical protein LJK87_42860 [Paenibacillus sp. P25]